MMSWFLLSLITAGFASARDIAMKGVARDNSPPLIAAVLSGSAGMILLLLALLFEPLPDLMVLLPIALTAAATISLGWLLYATALRHSAVSLLAPLRPLSVVYIFLGGILFLQEIPTFGASCGIALIVFGAYLLGTARGQGVFDPIRAVFSDKGARLMLVVAFFFGCTGVTEKYGISRSSPLFFSAFENLLCALLLFPLVLASKEKTLAALQRNWRGLVLVGILTSLMFCSQSFAMNLTHTAYVASIKSLSVLLTIVIGGRIFAESDLLRRSLAGTVVILGTVLIALWS